MRTLALSLIALTAGSVTTAHENQCYECGDSLSAGRTVQLAAFEDRFYRRVDHAARMRRLRAEISYTEARIVALRRVQQEYDRVNRFGTGNALTLSAEQVRLNLHREEIVLRELRDQVLLEQRAYRLAKRAYAQRIRQTAAQSVVSSPAAGEPQITIIQH